MEVKLQAQKIREILSLDKNTRTNLNPTEYKELAKISEPWRIHTKD